MNQNSPVIAIVGRPNVGKSTLFNYLTATRHALVANIAGLTRDRQYGYATIHDQNVILIDTGGIEDQTTSMTTNLMVKQTAQALNEAHVIILMLDAKDGLLPDDQFIMNWLRKKYQKPLFVVINKIDACKENPFNDFYALGQPNMIGISASHGDGMRHLLNVLQESLKNLNLSENETAIATQLPSHQQAIYFAVIGRPNVGKSTLVNRMLGEDRVIVCDEAGTTRDSIYIPLTRLSKEYVIIDTAGVRRRARVTDTIEKFSIIKTLQAIEQAHVALILIDAHQGLSEQDMRIIQHAYEQGRAMVVAINKWDGLDAYQRRLLQDDLDRRLSFIDYVEKFFISALHGSNVGHLYAAIERAYKSAIKKLSTSQLTRILQTAVGQHQPPLVRGHRIKLRYAHPGGALPPCIVIHGTLAEDLPLAYQRYLENFFRQALKMVGTPIRIQLLTTENPYISKDANKKPVNKSKRHQGKFSTKAKPKRKAK